MTSNEAEFSAFVADRSAALYRTAYYLTGGDRHAAQDLVQDALGDAYARWGSIRDASAREAFVRRIMVRTATRRWNRRQRTREVLTAQPPDCLQPGHEEATATSVDLAQALGLLSARQRAVIVLRYYDDLNETQIAEALGCSTGAVKTHATRAIKALNATIGGTTYAPTARALEDS
jgi:RNA polymerase sigma-70 factor (sigma-E family)